MLDTYGRKYADRFIEPGASIFEKIKWKPTHVTIAALMIGLIAAAGYLLGLPTALPVLLLWFSGYLDTVDGALARRTGHVTALGTLLDIFFDRVVELTFIVVFAIRHPESVSEQLFLTCAIVLSMTVFLTGGNLLKNTGIKTFRYQTGLMERTDGFIMFTIMMIFNDYMKFLTAIYAALILFTAMQRLVLTIMELSRTEKEGQKNED